MSPTKSVRCLSKVQNLALIDPIAREPSDCGMLNRSMTEARQKRRILMDWRREGRYVKTAARYDTYIDAKDFYPAANSLGCNTVRTVGLFMNFSHASICGSRPTVVRVSPFPTIDSKDTTPRAFNAENRAEIRTIWWKPATKY
jgi:hypothetical protein